MATCVSAVGVDALMLVSVPLLILLAFILVMAAPLPENAVALLVPLTSNASAGLVDLKTLIERGVIGDYSLSFNLLTFKTQDPTPGQKRTYKIQISLRSRPYSRCSN